MKNGDYIEIDGFGLGKSERIVTIDGDEYLKMTTMLGRWGVPTLCMLREEYLSRHQC